MDIQLRFDADRTTREWYKVLLEDKVLMSEPLEQDDIRIWMRARRLGWRWLEGKLKFKYSWRMEEARSGMTGLEKTSQVMEGIMNSVCSWLRLTMEHEGMFGGVLPTLDLILWVNGQNKTVYSFFEKPMASNMVLHKRSAMPEGVRRATLNQERVRWIINTLEDVPIEQRVGIVDG